MSAPSSSSPLYLKVSNLLRRQIESGEYPVGSLLPPELVLARDNCVSRQTVRQAIRHLREQKLVSARKGVGTRVEAHDPDAAFYHSLQSLSDIFQFASEAVLHIESEGIVEVHGGLAAELGCRAGKKWLRLEGYRRAKDHRTPLCWTEVHVDARFAPLVRGRGSHATAIFSTIERQTGEAVQEVDQQIAPVIPAPELARTLGAPVGAPALSVRRRYYGSGRRLIERSVNIHPADRFTYTMRFSRDVGGAAGPSQ